VQPRQEGHAVIGRRPDQRRMGEGGGQARLEAPPRAAAAQVDETVADERGRRWLL